MSLVELNRALKQLRLGGMAGVLETRLLQPPRSLDHPSYSLAPLVLLSYVPSAARAWVDTHPDFACYRATAALATRLTAGLSSRLLILINLRSARHRGKNDSQNLNHLRNAYWRNATYLSISEKANRPSRNPWDVGGPDVAPGAG